MRVDVKKYLFIGLKEDREAFFKAAQQLGIIEFIDSKTSPPLEAPETIQHLSSALRIVKGLPVTEQEEVNGDLSEADSIAIEVLALRSKEEALLEQQRVLHQERARILPFGDFSFDDIAYIERVGNCKVQFFCAKKGKAEHMKGVEGVLYVDSDHGLDYFMSVQKQPTQFDDMIEMRFEHSLSQIDQRLVQLERDIHNLDQAVKTFAKYYDLLDKALIGQLNHYYLNRAKGYVQPVAENFLFAVEGWAPIDKGRELDALTKDHHVYHEEIAIEETDRIPTYLENYGVKKIGEDLINIYDTPSHTDKDPSIWVLAAFALFFAMIVGDGGYGLLFLGMGIYFTYKFGKQARGLGKRVLRLVLILSMACIVWGFLTNGFFSIGFDIEHPLRKISLLNWMAEKKVAYHLAHKDDVYQAWIKNYPATAGVTNPHEILALATDKSGNHVKYALLDKFYDNIFMELALFFGTIHLITSMARYSLRNKVAIGWILFLIGGYLYFPEYLNATSLIHFIFGVNKVEAAKAGYHLMLGGIGLAVLLAIWQHKFLGILEIMTVIQVFADVLSYLRLYALGMSGSIVSGVVNEAALSMNFLFAFVILLLGHSINIALGIMSGVIHGLRLNFIEWYHYSFEGGGKRFEPLKYTELD